MTLTTQLSEQERTTALLQAVGLDRLNVAQRELAINIANRYGLDLMLKHLVMIEGRPYITRDGLLHVAHVSGQLDGIETTVPVLDDDGKFWRSTCSVFRKDMSRPFTYAGRYPANGSNQKYAPEMAVKVGEVMALRRAFDVAAPTVEERWDEAAPADPVPDQPSTLTARIEAKAAQVAEPAEVLEATMAPEAVERPQTPETVETVSADVSDPVEVPGSSTAVSPVRLDPAAEPADGPTFAEFKALVKDVPPARVKAIAKDLYPDGGKFADLQPGQLQAILDRIVDEDEVDEADPVPDARDIVEDPTIAAGPSTPETAPEVMPTGPSTEPPTIANGGIVLCGARSPYSENTCTLDQGHAGKTHRFGVSESW